MRLMGGFCDDFYPKDRVPFGQIDVREQNIFRSLIGCSLVEILSCCQNRIEIDLFWHKNIKTFFVF